MPKKIRSSFSCRLQVHFQDLRADPPGRIGDHELGAVDLHLRSRQAVGRAAGAAPGSSRNSNAASINRETAFLFIGLPLSLGVSALLRPFYHIIGRTARSMPSVAFRREMSGYQRQFGLPGRFPAGVVE